MKILLIMPDQGAAIEGHTDSTGSAEYNLDLSQRRAGAVRQFMQLQGLEAVQGDALQHLEGLPARSLDGIFSAQVVEHLTPAEIVQRQRRVGRRATAGRAGDGVRIACPGAGQPPVPRCQVMLPPSGRRMLASMRTVVVLPAPFGPSRAKISPRRTENEIPCSTRLRTIPKPGRKSFTRPSTWITSSAELAAPRS